MKISRKADYGMRAVIYIARQPKEKRNPIDIIAESECIPRDFLAKILKDLTRADILRSYQGVHGGYQLARSASQISLLDIVEAMDGQLGLDLCVRAENGCDKKHSAHQVMCPFFTGLQKQVRTAFKTATVAKLLKGLGRR
jgi:Rrf2 family iron-sulfur cluster assembly transcriptional regulator